MNIIATDDERIALQAMVSAIREALPEAGVHAFRKGSDAILFARENHCDIAFLDIQMGSMSGIALAKYLKDINPKINIIFVTGYTQYTGEALSLYVSGYIMKPATKEKIVKELENLRHPLKRVSQHRMRVQAFGNFEVFIGEERMKFRYSKTKELLAYLIDRKGAAISVGELCAVLWEDKEDSAGLKSQLRNSISDLNHCLAEAGVQDVLLRYRGSLAINVEALDCDYYRFLQMEANAVNTYFGEYMSQYSWTEMTLGGLEQMRWKQM